MLTGTLKPAVRLPRLASPNTNFRTPTHPLSFPSVSYANLTSHHRGASLKCQASVVYLPGTNSVFLERAAFPPAAQQKRSSPVQGVHTLRGCGSSEGSEESLATGAKEKSSSNWKTPLQKLNDIKGAAQGRPQESYPDKFFRRRRLFSAGPILVSASVAAAAFVPRLREANSRANFALAAMSDAPSGIPLKKIDTHLHVWAAPEEALAFPYFPGQEPPPQLLGSADFLLQSMAEAGVAGALIVQPINHKFDHSYVTSAIRKHPGKFLGCCLADPTEGGGGVGELQRLVREEGYRAVRFNPYLWPQGQKMTNDVGRALFAAAGELGVPVGFMCFKGLLLHIEEIEQLCEAFPATRVLVDHLGFCRPASNPEEQLAWEKLLGLARFPQVYVKTSAFFRVSREEFPYRDTWTLVRQLVDTFGAERIMWGSDFPFVVEQCGYAKAWQVLPEPGGGDEVLSREERALVMGGTAMALFPGAWESPA